MVYGIEWEGSLFGVMVSTQARHHRGPDGLGCRSGQIILYLLLKITIILQYINVCVYVINHSFKSFDFTTFIRIKTDYNT